MGLIKRDQIEEKGTLVTSAIASKPRPAPSAVPLQPALGDKDIPKAKSEAQRIVGEAMKEADAIREEAREAGREEGRSEASTHIEEALGTLNQAITERKKIIKDSEQEILRLAIKVAEQIIKSEVSMHRDVCLNIVAEAISRVSDREQIIIRVNRDDAEYLKRYKDRLTGMLDGVKSFSIIEDANVEAGGCVIETNLGFVDAKIETKIKSIEEFLKKASSEEES
ncbi:MAG: FliH/SctL family protein [Candidatus Margulisiibacteriota bacterium]